MAQNATLVRIEDGGKVVGSTGVRGWPGASISYGAMTACLGPLAVAAICKGMSVNEIYHRAYCEME